MIVDTEIKGRICFVLVRNFLTRLGLDGMRWRFGLRRGAGTVRRTLFSIIKIIALSKLLTQNAFPRRAPTRFPREPARNQHIDKPKQPGVDRVSRAGCVVPCLSDGTL